MSHDAKPETRMDRLHKSAQIFALVFIPIAVAAVGWATQYSVSRQGVRKDLIQMSLQVLKEPRQPGDEYRRQWARETINRNSDVRLTEKAADQLGTSAGTMLRTNPFLTLAMEARPPCPRVDLAGISADQRGGVQQLQALCDRNHKDLFWMQVFGKLLRDYRPEETAKPTR